MSWSNLKDEIQLPQIGTRERHAEQIYWAMVDWLSKSEVAPGDRLPNETELAELFAVSKPTIREALRVLEYSGLVESRRGRFGGLFAGSGAVTQVMGAMKTLFVLGDRSVEELYEARSILEVGVARLAAVNITRDELEKLEESIAMMERNESPESVRQSNAAFHLTVAESSRNNILNSIVVALIRLLNEMSPPGSHFEEAVNKVRVDNHIEIVEALRLRDPERAAIAMRRHVTLMSEQRRLARDLDSTGDS